MKDPISRLNDALQGRYRVERRLGEGGMAAVFLARDVRHERNVALKVLKPELAAVVGAERFLAEIRTTATLQHPNILPLFDSGEADGFLFYVMPYVEGESLRDRLDREGPLPVDEAVGIAVDVAEALHAAHELGVIHRDVKPANILLSKGRPLVADFGIALAVSEAGGGRLTETGLSMGTPYYMSPEQAAADRDPDARSDIYSLGCVLYEALVGEPPYTGPSAQAVLAKILTGAAAPVREARESVPPHVDAVIRTCLAKVPADRFASAQDLARALRDPSFRPRSVTSGAASADRWARVGPGLAALAAVAVAFGAWGWLRPTAEPARAWYELSLPGGGDELSGLLAGAVDLSPDGQWMVGRRRPSPDGAPSLWIKRKNELDWTPVPGTEEAFVPRISPDGTRIAFLAEDRRNLQVILAEGGLPLTVAEGVGFFDWLSDDSLAVGVADGGSVVRVPADGGPATEIWASDSLSIYGVPTAVPGGRALVIPACAACPIDRELHVVDVESGMVRPLSAGLFGRVLADGTILITDLDGRLHAAGFDLDRLEMATAPAPVMEGLATHTVFPGLAVSAAGDALLMLGPAAAANVVLREYEAVWVSRTGTEELAVEGWRFRLSNNFGHSISPDGSRLAIGLQSETGADVWVKELPDGPLTRLLLDDADDARPTWSPDGRFIWFQSTRTGQYKLYRARADGADPGVYVPTPGREAQEARPSPDGEWMVVRVDGANARVDSGRDIVAYRLDGDSTEIPLLTSEYDEFSPRLSPDGRWLAYTSTESGRYEVFVRPFPDVDEGRTQVSADGGTHPLWKGDGTEIYYVRPPGEREARSMMVARVDTVGGFGVRGRERLFDLSPELLTTAPWEPVVDVTRDGERFLMMRRVPEPSESGEYRWVLVENFLQGLTDSRR